MRIDTPEGFTEIPDQIAVKKVLNGINVIVIDGCFFPYSEWNYKDFCKQTTSYSDVTDLLPESIDVKPLMNDESLTAYAWWNKSQWEKTEEKITYHNSQIKKLELL